MRPIFINNLNLGGIAESDFMGNDNSVAELVGIDLHSTPGLIKVKPKLTKVTDVNAPNELCKAHVVCSNGRDYYFSSSSGNIWENNNDVWSLKYTTSALNGESKCLGAKEYEGFIYWATQNFIHRIKVSNASGAWDTSTVELGWADLTVDQELTTKVPIALRFDGSDDYLVTSSVAINHTDNVTLSCWFYAEQDTSDTRAFQIWGTNDTASSLQIKLGGNTDSIPNKNRVAVYSGSTLVAQTDSNAFVSGAWNHLVYSRDGATHSIYINGVLRTLITNVSTSFANTTAVRYIGIKNSSLVSPFQGLLADLRIQSISLSAADVLAIYEGKKHSISSTLVYYPLNNTTADLEGVANATISGNPSFYYITDFDLPYRTVLASSLSEIDTDKKFVKVNSETIDYVKLWVVDKGTGNITITLHDSTNTLVESVTIANVSLVNGWNYFALGASGLTYGGTYHMHVYASTTDVYIKSTNVNDIADGAYIFLSDGDAEFHHMRIQNNTLFIGDRNYIHQIDKNRVDGTHIFTSRALDIPAPLRVKCLGIFETDLLVGTIVDSRIAKSMVYRWNTWSQSWSVSDEIPEEGINAFIDADNFVEVSAGQSGNIYYYNGKNLELMRTIKGDYDSGGKMTVHADATSNFKGLPLIGVSNVSGNPTQQGIYAFGSRNSSYPTILSLEYPISERDAGEFVLSDVEIGTLVIAGNDMYVSWKHGVTCGIDKLDYTTKLDGAYITTRHMDLTKAYADNYREFQAKYALLPTNTSLSFQYRKNYNSWVDMTDLRNHAEHKKFIAAKTIEAAPLQLRFIFNTNNNDAPQVTDFIILAE